MSKNYSGISAINNLCTTMLGVGLYYTPYTFAQSGAWIGFGLLAVIITISSLANIALFFSADKIDKELKSKKDDESMRLNDIENQTPIEDSLRNEDFELSYASIGGKVRPFLKIVLDIMIVAVCFSVCLFFQKYIGETLTTLRGGNDNTNALIIAGLGLLFCCAAQVKDLTNFSWISNLNVVSIFIISSIIVAGNFFLSNFVDQHVPNPNGESLFSIGNFIFAMSCQVNIVNVYSNLKEKNRTNLILIGIGAPLLCGAFYGIVGLVGGRLFGENMPKADIIGLLANPRSDIRQYIDLNHPDLFYLIYGVVVLALTSLGVSYIFILNVVTRSITETNLINRFSERKRILIITIITIAVMTLINCKRDLSLDAVFSFISNVMCIPLAFIFPAMFVYFFFGKNNLPVKASSIFFIIGSISFAVFNLVYPLLNVESTSNVPIGDNSTEPMMISTP